MKKLITVLLIIVVLGLIAGCAVKGPVKDIDTTTDITVEEDSDVAEIEQDIAEIEDLDIDAELAELDTLEADLANI